MKAAVVLTILLTIGASSELPQSGQVCAGMGWSTACATNDGTQVDVGGSKDGNDPKVPPTSPDGRADDREDDAPLVDSFRTGENNDVCNADETVCRGLYTVAALPDVAASDLTSFIPAGPSFSAEPGEVGIVGMPTNFVATAAEQTQAGVLFDLPVTVRFVPSGYVFDYGDGTSGRSVTGGASWSSLGQAQFSATPTSHAYGARGTYAASVAVEYTAAVDFGTGWRPVTGVVTADGGAQAITVYEAHTALVDRTCAENPTGPGC